MSKRRRANVVPDVSGYENQRLWVCRPTPSSGSHPDYAGRESKPLNRDPSALYSTRRGRFIAEMVETEIASRRVCAPIVAVYGFPSEARGLCSIVVAWPRCPVWIPVHLETQVRQHAIA